MNAPVPLITIPHSTPLGTRLDQGWLAGRIRRADKLIGVVVPPKAERAVGRMPWADKLDRVREAESYFDGEANTAAMSRAGSQLATMALDRGLYVPARDELETIYRTLKPGTFTCNQWRAGDNPSSDPAGYPYTEDDTLQTAVLEFRPGGAEAFEERIYWSSTQFRDWSDYAWFQDFVDGSQNYDHKSDSYGVVFVRSVLIR